MGYRISEKVISISSTFDKGWEIGTVIKAGKGNRYLVQPSDTNSLSYEVKGEKIRMYDLYLIELLEKYNKEESKIESWDQLFEWKNRDLKKVSEQPKMT